MNGRVPEFCGPQGCQSDPTCWGWEDHNYGDWITLEKDADSRLGWRDLRAAYSIGDRLWVREMWACIGREEFSAGEYIGPGSLIAYRATWSISAHKDGRIWARGRARHQDGTAYTDPKPWRPSIHMPRWASRLTLTVTDVRVQRLQEISEDDAKAEGAKPWTGALQSYVTDFATVWNSIHGPGAWDANPWVTALTFGVHRRNIDRMPK